MSNAGFHCAILTRFETARARVTSGMKTFTKTAAAFFRHAGRDFRLTNVHGNVVKATLA
jgi:hypothetical protein